MTKKSNVFWNIEDKNLQKQILNELSKQLLSDKGDKTKEIVVDVIDKQIVFLNK